MQKIFLSLILFFVLELIVIIEVGSSIGALNTIFVMFLMMILGVVLIKMRFRQALEGLKNGTSVFFLPLAGFLFLFPGFISDIIGLLLLIPRIQTRCVRFYNDKRDDSEFFTFAKKESDAFFHKGNTIDGTAEHVDNDDENKSIR